MNLAKLHCLELCRLEIRTQTFLFLLLPLFFTLSLCAFAGSSQEHLVHDIPLQQYLQRLFQTEQGLPQNFVRSLCQTRDGYLWIATQQGLVRFDGIRFVVFDKSNSPFHSPDIAALAESPNGTLWIATAQSGVWSYTRGVFSPITALQDSTNGEITAIGYDSTGALWVGTSDRGVIRFHEGRITRFEESSGLLGNRVTAITVSQTGTVYIGTRTGLHYWKNNAIHPLILPTLLGMKDNPKSLNSIAALAESPSGELWVGTDSGLISLSGRYEYASHYTTKHGLAHNRIRSLHCDNQGIVWVGTRENGFSRYAHGVFDSFTPSDGLPAGFVSALLCDREGSIWVGMLDGGLIMLRQPRVRNYTTANGLSNNVVFSLAQANDGTMWAGTLGGGATRFWDNKVISYTSKQGLLDNTIWSLAIDKKGGVWLGTYYGGASYFQNGTFKTYTIDNGLADNTIWAILPDQTGAVWFGTPQGLTMLNEYGKATTYTEKHGLPGSNVWSIYEDTRRTLWVGTDKGAAFFRNGKFAGIPTVSGLSDNDTRTFLEDSLGAIWIGTASGLLCFKNGKTTAITNKNGLFDGMVYSILDDRQGYLWMSHTKGISRIRLDDLYDVVHGKKQRLSTVLHFGTADGMKTTECNGGTQSPAWRSSNGNLWFATSKGIAVINPKMLWENKLPPPVAIESILADTSLTIVLNAPDALAPTFAPGVGKFEFHYTALSFRVPERVRFRYKLEGYDQEWVEAGARRTAYYTNLPHDRQYIFRVQACNDDGLWNEIGASAPFYIAPYFYETVWFYGLCALALIGSSIGTFRLRSEQLRRRAKELEKLVEEQTRRIAEQAEREYQSQLELERIRERDRISQDMHDDIGATLTELSLLGELLKSDLVHESIQSPKVTERADTIADMSRSAIDSIAEIIWTTNSRNDNIEHLSIYLRNFAARYLDRAGIEYHIDFPTLPPREIRSDSRRALLLILKESLHNIVKHSHASLVTLHLAYTNSILTLRINDNGKGFDTLENFPGHGLAGMHKRIAEVGGTYSLSSTPDAGTHIECSLHL